MCGRYTLTRDARALAESFSLADAPPWSPRFNVAPTQSVFAVLAGRRGALMRWGFAAPWGGSAPLINAMAETAASKPAFREAFRQRRCLVLADGFYEWLTAGKRKRARWFTLAGGGPFAFAALYQPWGRDGQPADAACVLTTAANELVRPAHARMPVILSPEAHDVWLSAESDTSRLGELLRSYPAEEMDARAVGETVNNVRNEGPRCVAPAAPEGPAQMSLF